MRWWREVEVIATTMDILSHGLYGALYGKVVNQKLENHPVHIGWAFWWGIFPDIFAFAPGFVYDLYRRLRGMEPLFRKPDGTLQSWTPGFDSVPHATQFLYQISHSLVVFALVFGVVWLLTGRIPWVLIPWAMHILMDVPTHSMEFYPTPVLWPVSDWKFLHGFSWAQGWFMATNYGILLLLYLRFW